MNRSFAFVLVTSLALCGSQVCQAAEKKNPAAEKRSPSEQTTRPSRVLRPLKARTGIKRLIRLRKPPPWTKNTGNELSAVYQQRGYAAANDQRYGEPAINDYNEALKLTPQQAPRIHEQRAAVEMKIQDYDKALADYSELIKLKPSEIKYMSYRAYIDELKNDLQNSMADNETILKLDPNNQDAKTRKNGPTKDYRKNAAYSSTANAHAFACPVTKRQKEALRKRSRRPAPLRR